jgi:hypothetical protein
MMKYFDDVNTSSTQGKFFASQYKNATLTINAIENFSFIRHTCI